MHAGEVTYKPIVSISCSAIIIIFQLIFVISLSYKFCTCPTRKSKDSDDDDYDRRAIESDAEQTNRKIFQSLSIGIFIFLALSFTCWIVNELMYREFIHRHHGWLMWFWLYFMLLGVSYILFYILLLFRLYHTFDDSVYSNKSIIYKVHIANIACLFLMGCVAVYIRSTLEVMFYILAVIIFLSCLLSAIHLITLFNKQLFELTLDMRRRTVLSEVNEHPNSKQNKVEIEITDQQQNLLRLIRKQSLLAGIIFSMMIINLLWIGVYPFFPGGAMYVAWWIMWCVTLSAATWSVYLQFKWADGCYRVICSRCDMRCASVCERMAGRRIVMLKMLSMDRIREEQRTDMEPMKIDSVTADDPRVSV
eukprot:CAMPEP_0197021790 /NCGR_PEP_ID=MMETSP1384-20130603/2708_1 /TAXON_ID=29189 /ORGANISM="Ammonia sp." /LENGTH=362 /DNA_ID=CAMNT_0042449697 /DNA_START=30 /DNA_END=1118 /DNA_ORIENTATION=-